MKKEHFIKIILFAPKSVVQKIIFEQNNNIAILFPFIIGFIIGVLRSLPMYNPAEPQYSLGLIVGYALGAMLLSLIITYFYTLIVLFFCYLFKGVANFKMIFSILSYSMIPAILGIFFLGSIVILFQFFHISNDFYAILLKVLTQIHRLFLFYTLLIFIRSLAFINKFSIVKSIISGVGIVVVLILIGLYQSFFQ